MFSRYRKSISIDHSSEYSGSLAYASATGKQEAHPLAHQCDPVHALLQTGYDGPCLPHDFRSRCIPPIALAVVLEFDRRQVK
jgi:hypothetical protein